MIGLGDVIYEAEIRPKQIAEMRKRQPALPVRRRSPSLAMAYRRWMARLGDLLVSLGCALQTRYVAEGQPTACAS
jgi:hypothetical protein